MLLKYIFLKMLLFKHNGLKKHLRFHYQISEFLHKSENIFQRTLAHRLHEAERLLGDELHLTAVTTEQQ